MREVYLDNAATTPMSPKVINVITDEMKNDFGNASSTYELGRKARNVIDKARHQIAQSINAQDGEIIFTSGGSESNNTAIFGTAYSRKNIGKKIITTKIEHPSVLNPMKRLEKEGYQVVYLNVDQSSHISLEQLKQELTPDTILVSTMAVNNEVGSIMPLKEIGEMVKDTNAYFHVDNVQGMGTIDIDVRAMHIDLLSVSAHKINGPKFLGFLYEKSDIDLPNLVLGGEQEVKRRAGTENVPGIAGFGEAVKELSEIGHASLQERYQHFQEIILHELDAHHIDYQVNGGYGPGYSHHVLNLAFPGVSTTTLQTNLDLNGFAVSGGSACTAGSLEPSHVLIACFGPDSPRIHDSIRISFGRYNTDDEVQAFAENLIKVVQRIQSKNK
ncbi:cysteine desulfurase family protein [Lactobacillus kefiranofaciens]|uniref:Cysteine desulfurase n=1 Tax=Lactobacillus kefiranofaciens TaxID=267818 RepID=A0AAX3UF42_9LACO|nr:cysteine desulfurase family protein [Lactobacillus kefiranofaciens]AEG40521.1 Cysteine desulfurase [Lactobacillus kefiranofaciens subsp. kefiranofaciens]KRM22546.1 Cysteine desulfurase [Lactobacillus kefiranofaciens subsp. kefiranofaciens DSM 5016 = JCM 6985]MCP9330980.1 cysteine desulfurase [Lactobacillus kefiranofaciens]MDH5100321.1 cysteine desulfurase [Lactobacillus kefiranofaciens]QFQ68049.1 cysteine desulfurase [Lactobacillus kefiranofaciens subsp. kefiranofaciens]